MVMAGAGQCWCSVPRAAGEAEEFGARASPYTAAGWPAGVGLWPMALVLTVVLSRLRVGRWKYSVAYRRTQKKARTI